MYININDTIKIKLTNKGKEILLQKDCENSQFSPQLVNYYSSLVDSDGYMELPLWEIMSVFGNQMYNGNPNIPFETTIEISQPVNILEDNTSPKSR